MCDVAYKSGFAAPTLNRREDGETYRVTFQISEQAMRVAYSYSEATLESFILVEMPVHWLYFCG